MKEHASYTHNHTAHGEEHHHGHEPFYKPTKEENWMNRYRKQKETRQIKRKTKDLDVIFHRALKDSKKEFATEEHHEPLPESIQNTIVTTAERLGKDTLLLDPTFSDERLHRFAHAFASRHEKLHEKYTKRKNLSNVLKRTIVGGNLGIGIAEALTAGGASAIWTDVGHNIADAYVYNEQLNNVQEPNSLKAKSYKRRKTMYTILSASSALLAAKSGIDIVWDTDASADPLAVYTAGGSVVFNAGIGLARYRQMREKRKEGHAHSHHDSDVNKHLLVDSASAVLAFVGATAGSGIIGPLAGIISGGLGAKLFYPSESNLRHSYHAHDGDDDHNHNHEHTDTKNKKQIRYKKTIAAATSAVFLLAGGIGIKAIDDDSSSPKKSDKTLTATHPDAAIQIPTPYDKALKSTIAIPQGSNLWSQSERVVQKILGEKNTSMTDIVVDYATMQNDLKNPDVIQMGKYESLSKDAIQVIYDAKNTPATTIEGKTFAADIEAWNKIKPSIKDEKQKKRFQRMKTYIQQTLQK